jgi:hypothetical protein
MGLLFASDAGSVCRSEFVVLSLKMGLRESFGFQVFRFSFSKAVAWQQHRLFW